MIGYPYMPDGKPPKHPVIFITDHGVSGLRCNCVGGDFGFGYSFPVQFIDGVWTHVRRTEHKQQRGPFKMTPVCPYLDAIWRGRTPHPETLDEVALSLPIRVWDPDRGPVYPDA